MFGHHLAPVRLAGRKRHARFESSEALAEQPAVAHTAVELHGCCARVSLAEALLSQHVDCVTRSGISPGTETQVARALLGPAHHVGARRRERNRTVRGPATELDDEANSQIADG